MNAVRCDSHIHVVGPADQYLQVANRTYLAAPASLSDIERLGAARDVRRFVIVQPSFYGTDNTLLLESLAALQGRGRGVAVIEPETISRADVVNCNKRGVRGLRINLYSPLGPTTSLQDRFDAIERLARNLDWHIEVIAPLKILAQEVDLLARAIVPVVIDHYGLYAGFTPNRAEGRALIELVRLPHVWIKLSAPYRSSYDPLATRPDPIWMAELLNAAPDRCVWGSDWPHTPPHEKQGDANALLPYRPLAYETVVDEFCAAVGSAELCERILSVNPAKLYRFPEP
jgi:predicted TIM-barrel fold metal-dependent hydrolase